MRQYLSKIPSFFEKQTHTDQTEFPLSGAHWDKISKNVSKLRIYEFLNSVMKQILCQNRHFGMGKSEIFVKFKQFLCYENAY